MILPNRNAVEPGQEIGQFLAPNPLK
jgi:hypothetical protein